MSEQSKKQYFTKKELEQRCQIADTTVIRTLKAAGLDTSKRIYTRYEVAVFLWARHLFRSGLKAKEVKEYFQMKPISEFYHDY